MLFVERHFLLTYGGGFTENFYGLKRERVLHIESGQAPRTQIAAPGRIRESLKLRKSDIWKNLAVMVGLPYLKRKLDESYDIHAPQATLLGPTYARDTLPPEATLRQRILYYYKWFLRNIYPSVNAAYYFSLLAFNLAYLFSNTAYSSPFLWIIQTRIRRMGAADYQAIDAASQPKVLNVGAAARPGESSSIFNPRVFFRIVYPRLLSSLKILLPTSIFALKFLEWWHASDFARQLSRKATEGLDLPPPIISGLPPPSKPQPTNRSTSTTHSSSVSLADRPGATPSSPKSTSQSKKPRPPISTISGLPILTVPAPTTSTSSLCPICLSSIVTPTAAQTGFVYCYSCIFRWVEGTHARQSAWMEGSSGKEGWGEDAENEETQTEDGNSKETRSHEHGSRVGRWESGKGRCAVTGRRLLGGTECLRRVMV